MTDICGLSDFPVSRIFFVMDILLWTIEKKFIIIPLSYHAIIRTPTLSPNHFYYNSRSQR